MGVRKLARITVEQARGLWRVCSSESEAIQAFGGDAAVFSGARCVRSIGWTSPVSLSTDSR
jgi:hypothetical protein